MDHLTTMTEAEARRGLRKHKEEYLRKQRGQTKLMKIKRSRTRKHRVRRFNGTNYSKSREQRNAHTCEKASGDGYIMEEPKYNKIGLAKGMPYEEFLHLASQKEGRHGQT